MRAAAVLLVLLGLARGGGGIALLTGGAGTLVAGPRRAAVLMGCGLAFVALLAGAAAVELWRLQRRSIALTAAALLIFVTGGLLNGYLMFGAPRPAGILLNVGYSAVVGALVFAGRDALLPRGRKRV